MIWVTCIYGFAQCRLCTRPYSFSTWPIQSLTDDAFDPDPAKFPGDLAWIRRSWFLYESCAIIYRCVSRQEFYKFHSNNICYNILYILLCTVAWEQIVKGSFRSARYAIISDSLIPVLDLRIDFFSVFKITILITWVFSFISFIIEVRETFRKTHCNLNKSRADQTEAGCGLWRQSGSSSKSNQQLLFSWGERTRQDVL